MKYLQEYNYYSDRYDLHTIQDCLRWIQIVKEKNTDKKLDEVGIKDKAGWIGAFCDFTLHFRKGELYRDKEKTIKEWMERDKDEQERYDSAIEPKNVFCTDCNWAMESDGKSLYHIDKEPPKVIFFFRCPKCHKGKGVFDNGHEYVPEIDKCPNCGRDMERKTMRKGKVITTVTKCDCGYKDKDMWDMKTDDERYKKKEEYEKELLAKYRNEFCMTKEEGDKYIIYQDDLSRFVKQQKEWQEKEDDPKYQKARSLKKLKVLEIQKLLDDTIKADGYDHLNFEKPEIERYVIIPFSVQDTKPNRGNYDSCLDLRKNITKALEDTNWRLMSEGVNCRLGILSGRIKGYESEDDLAKIV